MRYVSTRGQAPILTFEEAILTGLARDGGLYVPQSWPQFTSAEIKALSGQPYAEVAYQVIRHFTGNTIEDEKLKSLCGEAYGVFSHQAVAPLVQIGPNHFVLELFHGPTLAFKDVAMQFLGRIMDHCLEARKHKVTIIGATSGDTGSAAIEAFRGRDHSDIFILFPVGRVSDVQRRQMTTIHDKNVHAIAIDGTFDDCQNLVKTLFSNLQFRDSVALSAVNSINWGRILAQIVYYFTAALSLGSPARLVDFVVPSGNFGNIFAAYCAKRMGLPIGRLAIASNVNDILVRAVTSARYETTEVVATQSPSMDIQISSNLERLLFEAYDRDGDQVMALMEGLKQSGGFTISEKAMAVIQRDFDATRVNENECEQTMHLYHRDAGYLLDPHTAIGVKAAEKLISSDRPVITLGTAHPAKFPDAVKNACSTDVPLPERVKEIMNRAEHYDTLPNDDEILRHFIAERTRAKNVRAQ